MVVKFTQNKWFFFVHFLTEVRKDAETSQGPESSDGSTKLYPLETRTDDESRSATTH